MGYIGEAAIALALIALAICGCGFFPSKPLARARLTAKADSMSQRR